MIDSLGVIGRAGTVVIYSQPSVNDESDDVREPVDPLTVETTEVFTNEAVVCSVTKAEVVSRLVR